MHVSDFDFHLPPALIAPYPAAERDGSALLVMGRDATGSARLFDGEAKISQFRHLGEFLPPRSLLVVNETRVLPARLFGHKATGGRVEVLLLERVAGSGEAPAGVPEIWEAMARGLGRAPGPGQEIRCDDNLVAQIVQRGARGAVRVRLVPSAGRKVAELIQAVGEIPLPPYILAARAPGAVAPPVDDRERYQTVYAAEPGAVAAPTAGLHFTPELLDSLRAAGHDVARLTLHVGPGTFRPVQVDEIEQHRMDVERYAIPEATAAAIEDARRSGRAIVAVGTTVVRTLEAAALAGDGVVRAGPGATALFLRPGATFQVVTDLITNFHLPRSTLLMLVAAFAGRERVLAAYARAIEARLRFYSYGDAMFIRGTVA